jgi:hypothetical protein
VKRPSFKLLFSLGLALAWSSCNIFGFMDSPSGDAQLLSAARACFNDGDLTCAREYYAKVSNDNTSIRESELAFIKLEENGAGMAAFAEAFGGGFGGEGINRLARSIWLSNSTELATRRTNITAVYDAATVTNIPDAQMRALVQFAASTAVMGVVFAQHSGNGTLSKSEIVASATGCAAQNCAVHPDCNAGLPDTSGTVMASSTPSVELVNDLINNKISPALDALGAGGGFSTQSGLLGVVLGGGLYGCYRKELMNFGVGE